jgi:lipopolysaccharide transport protein LptA
LHAPQITQGDLRIEADDALATGIDFEAQSEWRFTGNVRITIETTELEAASAVFTFKQKRLSSGELEGTPVSFRDIDEARQTTVSGEARKMSYDNVARTLRLTDTARMQKDNVEFQGCDLIYDFAAERVTSGSADCADRFRVRVLREQQPSATDAPQ